MDRFLLGQLGANGDCLYATILARQIRHDYPDAHITWAISSQCVDVLHNNPDCDETWVVPIRGWDDHALMWRVFEREAHHRYRLNHFDRLILSQIWPNNFQNYDGTIRPSILRSYGRPITVPIENVINLTSEEKARVERFVRDQRIGGSEHRILFECSSKSGQSFLTPDLGQEVAAHLYGLLPDTVVIFNTHLPMELRDSRSRSAGSLSLRESAYLTEFCSLFVGCGSGGTVAATSTAARPLPNIQLLSRATTMFASFKHDFEFFGLDDRRFLEYCDQDPAKIAQCIAAACTQGIDAACDAYDANLPVEFTHYFGPLKNLFDVHRYLDVARSLLTTADRYGWTPQLLEYADVNVVPNLKADPAWYFADNRRLADDFRAVLADAAPRAASVPKQRAAPAELVCRNANSAPVLRWSIITSAETAPSALVLPDEASAWQAVAICDAELTAIRREITDGAIARLASLADSAPATEVVVRRDPDGHDERRERPSANRARIARQAIGGGRRAVYDHLIDTLCREAEGFPTGGVVVVGDGTHRVPISVALETALGYPCVALEAGYGRLGTSIRRGFMARPVEGSFFAWLSSPESGVAGIAAAAFLGTEGFETQIAALRDAGFTGPVFLAQPDGGTIMRLDPEPASPEPLPRISLVTPSYNQAPYIEETIRSVLDQGYENLEFVIVDGGSTDGSIDIIRRYEKHLHAFICEPDDGQSDAINKGFALTSGELMNWLCSDDLLLPGSLTRIGETYRRHGTDIIAGGCLRVQGQSDNIVAQHHNALKFGCDLDFDPLDILQFTGSWEKGNYFFQPEVFFSRKVWNASGGYIKRSLYYAMDYDLWMRMAWAGTRVRHIPQQLGASRIHDAQKTRSDRQYLHQLETLMQEYRAIFSGAANTLNAEQPRSHVMPALTAPTANRTYSSLAGGLSPDPMRSVLDHITGLERTLADLGRSIQVLQAATEQNQPNSERLSRIESVASEGLGQTRAIAYAHGDLAERQLLLQGRLASNAIDPNRRIGSLEDVEFRVFSQWGEDGIIDWLVRNVPVPNTRFVEFGVETFREANCRFLLQNRNWTGLVMDGSEANMNTLRGDRLHWMFDVTAKVAFVSAENINELITQAGFDGPLGILSIDIDSNDYWVWKAISCVNPAIVICEYNPIFGDLRPVVVPYMPGYERFDGHHSGLFFGSSIGALQHLARDKGYTFVGTNSNGINAFFVRDDLAHHVLDKMDEAKSFPSKHRDSRDESGQLSYTGGLERLKLLKDCSVFDVEKEKVIKLGDIEEPYSQSWLQQMNCRQDTSRSVRRGRRA